MMNKYPQQMTITGGSVAMIPNSERIADLETGLAELGARLDDVKVVDVDVDPSDLGETQLLLRRMEAVDETGGFLDYYDDDPGGECRFDYEHEEQLEALVDRYLHAPDPLYVGRHEAGYVGKHRQTQPAASSETRVFHTNDPGEYCQWAKLDQMKLKGGVYKIEYEEMWKAGPDANGCYCRRPGGCPVGLSVNGTML